MLASLIIGMMILSSPLSAASSTQIVHFNGLIAPAAWGAPLMLPGSPTPPGPGQFPPPPLLVVLIPTNGHMIAGDGSSENGVFVTLLVLMTDPTTQVPTLGFIGNSTSASFEVDARLTSASLTATVQGLDFISFSQKTVVITVSWTATDPSTGNPNPIIRTNMDSRVQTDGLSLFLHVSSQMRMATASGSLTVAGGPTVTLSPTPAAIARADIGSITRTTLP